MGITDVQHFFLMLSMLLIGESSLEQAEKVEKK